MHSLPAAAPPAGASLEELHSVSEASSQADRLAQSLELALSHGLEPPPLDPEIQPRYPCGVWRWKRQSDGFTIPFACHSWKCPLCSWSNARSWCELISYAPIARHIVITRLPGDRPVAGPLRNIVKAIRRGEAVETHAGHRRSRSFEYLATAEKHNRAGVHVHMLQHGDYVDQRLLSNMLPRYGAGKVTWIERIAQPDRMTALTRYVTRHLIAWLHPYQPKVGPRIRYSRRFFGDGSAVAIRKALRIARFGEPTEPWILLRSDPRSESELRWTPTPDGNSPPKPSSR